MVPGRSIPAGQVIKSSNVELGLLILLLNLFHPGYEALQLFIEFLDPLLQRFDRIAVQILSGRDPFGPLSGMGAGFFQDGFQAFYLFVDLILAAFEPLDDVDGF